MRHLEISAKTVEEATQLALEQLGVSREEVEITVIEADEDGDSASDEEPVRIRVTLPGAAREEITGISQEILENLLELLELEASVVVQEDTSQESADMTGPVLLNINGDDLGILIGRRGQTLAALQYIARIIASHRLKTKVPLAIDVEGYRERRIQSLQVLAQRLADHVVSHRESMPMQPMTAYERRIIHMELADDPDVTTHSIGTDDGRRVVIELKES